MQFAELKKTDMQRSVKGDIKKVKKQFSLSFAFFQTQVRQIELSRIVTNFFLLKLLNYEKAKSYLK